MNLVLLALLAISLVALLALLLRMRAIEGAAARRALARSRAALELWRQDELGRLRVELADLARERSLVELDAWKAEFENAIRRDAVQRSAFVTRGKVTEHLVPYLPDFEFNPRDARFLGSPIDFVVFDGLTQGTLRDVVFVEVKTGRAALTGRERLVRDAVESGRVRWAEVRPELGALTEA